MKYYSNHITLGAPYELAQFDHAPSTKLFATKIVYDLLALIQSNYPFSCQGNMRIPLLHNVHACPVGNDAKDDIILPYLDVCLIT